MNRRGFFRRTLGTIAGAALAPFLPMRVPPPLPVISTPAVNAVLADASLNLFNPSKDFYDLNRFVSIRYVKGFEFLPGRKPVRFDVLYGMATVNPQIAMRVSSD